MLGLRLSVGVVVASGWVAVASASAQPPPATPELPAVRVGGAIGQPTKTKDVKPIYPAEAQSARVQGVVILETTVGPTGRIAEARVLRSIPLLDEAAVSAVKQWEFTPTIVDGVPRSVIMTVTVNFSLGDSVPAAPPSRASGPPESITRMVVLLARAGPNGGRYVFEITPERSDKLPHWDQPSTGEPPLSMSQAQTLAKAWLRGRAPTAQGFELAASSFVRTRPAVPGSLDSPAIWYYSLGFDRLVGEQRASGGAESMVIVLLDGSIVEPRVESASAPSPGGLARAGQPGVTSPRPIARPSPSYTSAAMKAGIEGAVLLEAVVRPDGTVTGVKIIRSLDPVHGLDKQAIATAQQWRFEPGTRDGVAVPTVVTIELSFSLRKKR